MRPVRIVSALIGILLILPAIAMMLGGGAIGLGYSFGRDDDGYVDSTIDRLETASVAILATEIDLMVDPAGSDWVIDRLDAAVRLRVESSEKTCSSASRQKTQLTST